MAADPLALPAVLSDAGGGQILLGGIALLAALSAVPANAVAAIRRPSWHRRLVALFGLLPGVVGGLMLLDALTTVMRVDARGVAIDSLSPLVATGRIAWSDLREIAVLSHSNRSGTGHDLQLTGADGTRLPLVLTALPPGTAAPLVARLRLEAPQARLVLDPADALDSLP